MLFIYLSAFITFFLLILANEPQIFCESCTNELQFCFFFYQKCLETQQEFDETQVNVKGQELDEEVYWQAVIPETFLGDEENYTESFNNENESDMFNDVDGFEFENENSDDSLQDLTTNIEGHQSLEYNLICNYCPEPQQVGSVKNYISHLRTIHAGETKTTCPICSRTVTISSYREHYERRHYQGLKNFICDVCGVSYSRKQYLSAHMRTSHLKHFKQFHNSPNALIKCDECNVSFSYKSNYRRHMRNRHNNLPVHSILQVDNTELNKPQTGLSPKRIYNCKYCNFTSQKINLVINHQTTVHGKSDTASAEVQAHQTESQTSNLNQTELSVKNTKTIHGCKHCEYRSNLRWNVVRHMKRIHGDETKETVDEKIVENLDIGSKTLFKCEYCDYMSDIRANVKRHQNRQHESTSNEVIEQKVTGTDMISTEEATRKGPDAMEFVDSSFMHVKQEMNTNF